VWRIGVNEPRHKRSKRPRHGHRGSHGPHGGWFARGSSVK
jgi:hypothetical protein